MAPGDVLLTPNWCYHGHSNESKQEAYWIDFLDAPLVQALGPMFFEHHPEEVEPVNGVDESSPMRFAYAEYLPRLLEASEVSAGVKSLLLGPATLTTFDRTALRLAPGTAWMREKTTVNRIYAVVEGSGSCDFGETSVDWEPGDLVAVPSWHESRICVTSEATLLQVSDEPLLELLGWSR
jgi:gentisate 1,2-dioxygenase